MQKKKTGSLPVDSREYLSFLREWKGDAFVIDKFRPGEAEKTSAGSGKRLLNRWTADQLHASGEDSIRKNPIERFGELRDSKEVTA